MIAPFEYFHCLVQDLGRKVHNLHADVLKVILTNTAPVSSNTVLANITQIANGNGYVTNGSTAGNNSWSQTSGLAKLVADDVTFTASGGPIGPFQYAVIYNSTASGGPLIGWWDYDTPLTVADGDSFVVDLSPTSGALQLAIP